MIEKGNKGLKKAKYQHKLILCLRGHSSVTFFIHGTVSTVSETVSSSETWNYSPGRQGKVMGSK